MMKVLEVFGEPIANGGQESFVINLIEHIDLSGIQIDILTPYTCQNERYRRIVEENGGKVISLNLEFNPGKRRDGIYKPLSNYLAQNKYDVVHVHSGSISVLAFVSLAAKRNKVEKIIVHSHCAAEKITAKHILIKTVMTPILNQCPTHYCACSMVAGESKFSKKAIKKMILIKNGVDLSKFSYSTDIRDRIRKVESISDDAFVLGNVGRLSYQKNQEYLLEIVEKLKNMGKNIKLLLVGDGETKEQLKLFVKEKKLEDVVCFCGNKPNVNEYYSAMDVFVLPSRFEGLPIVGVEAQANGLPVIVSDNVSEELKITNLVEFLSLDRIERWTELLCEKEGEARIDYRKEMRAAGYDVEATAKLVRDIYMS